MFYGDLESAGRSGKAHYFTNTQCIYLENNEAQKAKSTQINALCR